MTKILFSSICSTFVGLLMLLSSITEPLRAQQSATLGAITEDFQKQQAEEQVEPSENQKETASQNQDGNTKVPITPENETVILENYKAISSYHDKLVDWFGSVINLWSILITSVVAIGGIAIPIIINRGYEKRLETIEDSIEKRFHDKVKTALDQVDSYKSTAESIQLQMEVFHLKDDLCITTRKKQIEKYSQLIKIEEKVAKHYFNRGTTYKHLFEHKKEEEYRKKAIEDFTSAIDLDPSDDEPYYNRGVCFEDQSQYVKALKDYEEAIKHDPHKPNYHISKAKVLSQLLRFKEAHETYEYIEKEFIENKNAIIAKAKTYILEGRLDDAKASLKGLLIREPYNIAVLESLMEIELKLSNYKTSERYAKRIEIYDLENYDALIGQINIQIELEQYEKALELCEKAIERKPQNYMGYFLKGKAHMHQGSFLDALGGFNAALRYEKNKTRVYNAMADLYERNNDNAVSLSYREEAIKVNPDKRTTYVRIAHYYLSKGEIDKAAMTLKEVFERHSCHAEAHLIHTLIIQKRADSDHDDHDSYDGYVAAIAEYEKWINKVKDWDNHAGLYQLAEAYAFTKQYHKAIEMIKRALKYCPFRYRQRTQLQYAYYHYKLGQSTATLNELAKLTDPPTLEDIDPKGLPQEFNLLKDEEINILKNYSNIDTHG